jgi:hypothetical protein
MASNIIKVEYGGQCVTLNLSDVAYIRFEKSIGQLSIYLTFGPTFCIFFYESNSSKIEDLYALYLDLYTKWRNKSDADKELELSLLNG